MKNDVVSLSLSFVSYLHPHSSYFHFIFTTDCELYAIGKPVFHKFVEEHYGSALKDPMPRNDVFAEKYWCTKQNDSYRLYEYANKAAYRNNAHTKTYRLEHPFRVSAFFVYL